ncbi:MAG: RNA pseudouridine synthase [Candidatus Campbellbacteria bacterium]|nr:RNA pseudouridine synthase [Candidatus Campbellbacteria bacterium]
MDKKSDFIILHEDKDVVVINKPAHCLVHKGRASDEETIADWVLDKYPDIIEVGEPFITKEGKEILRPGIVHRLDRETSGVLVIAKTRECFMFLKRQFQSREVKKEYQAFVYGNVKKQRGTVSRDIITDKKDIRKKTVARASESGREAITEYVVLSASKEASFISLFPKTGRTHQIRVHMKSIGHPIVCDKRYASGLDCILGFDRLALHAHSITVRLPSSSAEPTTFKAPTPKDFEKALNVL